MVKIKLDFKRVFFKVERGGRQGGRQTKTQKISSFHENNCRKEIMKQQFKNKLSFVLDEKLRKTCQKVLNDKKFFVWPASLSHHHAYVGGLAAHTFEVWEIAEDMAYSRFINGTNAGIIATACIWHDFLKTEEYLLADSPTPNQRSLQYDDKGFFVKKAGEDDGHSHIINGAKAFRLEAEKNEVDSELINQIEHCILSHHGFVRDWGSPLDPKSTDAMIVHFADMLSSNAGACRA